MNGLGKCPFLVQDRNLRRALIYSAVAALGLLAGILWDFEPLIGLSLAGLLLSLIIVLALALQRRKFRRILDPMVAGEAFVHWSYSPEEWAHHMAGEGSRVRRYLLRYLYLGAVMGGISGLILFGISRWLEKEALALSLERGAMGFAGLFLLCLLVGIVHDFFRSLRLAELRRIGGEIFIGREALYYSGELYLRAFYRKVEWKGLERPGLLFTFELPVGRGMTEEVGVLVPAPLGREREAAEACRKVQASW